VETGFMGRRSSLTEANRALDNAVVNGRSFGIFFGCPFVARLYGERNATTRLEHAVDFRDGFR
jgi:hypothetical protein